MVFTENTLGNAIADAWERNVDMEGIIDYVEYSGSEYEWLRELGIPVRDYVNPDGTSWPDGPVFHHKYLIADMYAGSEEAVLVTGSHNWSASAESINDENTLIIHDLNLANQFDQEFTRRFDEQITPLARRDDTITSINTLVNIGFLANDFLPESVSLDYEIVVHPSAGLASVASFTMNYQPQDNFEGSDSLSYRLFNTERPELADTAWIRIQVGETGISEEAGLYGFSFGALHVADGIIRADVFSREKQAATLRLYDRTGSLTASKELELRNGNNSLSIRKPARTGVYIIELTGEGGKLGKKILVR